MRNIHQIVKEINDATHFINNQIYQRYNELLDENITSAQDLLLTIIDTNKNLTVREIAEKLEITPSAASQQVSKLEEMNYVKRQINEKNKIENKHQVRGQIRSKIRREKLCKTVNK